MKYDYLIVGAGLFGSTLAYLASQAKKKCLVVEKRSVVGGNVYCERIENINVHKHGAHIFHTSNEKIWNFINKFARFNNYRHTVLANNSGQIYNLPFNMNTFNRLWGVVSPQEAIEKIKEQSAPYTLNSPSNLEEQALSVLGKDIYETFILEYTKKQWGRHPKELPAFIIKRLPLRFIYDNNYYNDRFQGIPIGGYNVIIEAMLQDVDVEFDCDYIQHRSELNKLARNIVFTGKIDEYFDFSLGCLDYRSLRFEQEVLNEANFQGSAVMNYCDATVPFTRIIEHKHFESGNQHKTVITREYPLRWSLGAEAYYPVNDAKNTKLYNEYLSLTQHDSHIYFGGRLAEFKYYDMDAVIGRGMNLGEKIL